VNVIEQYGQVKVTNATTGKPLAKVYVKAYVRTQDGQVKFHRDGYTDIRGRFDFATVSTPEKSAPQRFSVLVLSDEFGAVIREAAPPPQ
jgi:5-hydroxyisourate hydrolase-like protein (transthyretin family)